MEYLKAVLKSDKEKEIKNLKILIESGKKLNKNIKKYETELSKYENINKKVHIKIEPIKIEKPKTIKKIEKSKVISDTASIDYRYTIKSVESRKNMVIIDFKSPVSKSYVNFNEKRVSNGFQDIYDIKGSFKDA